MSVKVLANLSVSIECLGLCVVLAILPAREGLCPIILGVEDGTVADLVHIFNERFKAYCAPHSTLPPGSVILIGSLVHLQARGLEDYCDAVVGAVFGLTGRVGPNADVVPFVPVPLHRIGCGSTIRDIYDFDGWLATSPAGRLYAGLRSNRVLESRPRGGSFGVHFGTANCDANPGTKK